MILRITALGLFFLVSWTLAVAQEIIDPSKLHILNFEKIPSNKHEFSNNHLNIKVDKSSSALVFAYDQIRVVSNLRVEWRTTLKINAPTPKSERTKDGDDFPLRVGLIVAGQRPWLPFGIPKWIKLVSEWLKFPSNRMVYAVMGSSQPVGQMWPSPFSDSIENVSLHGEVQPDGFQISTWTFPELKIVGYWIMADGDNRKLSFESDIKSLKFW